LSRGPLAPELAANIIGQVLEALEYAHSRGVVHRDIKPENIMVQPDGMVKLMDFGIARLAQDRRLTSTGRTVGSLYYMSPEQIRGADDLDGRSDLYSLGITLYQCVTGKRPFDGDSDYSIMSAHMMSNPVPPVEVDPSLPKALNDVILRAIAKDREVRLPSAAEFRKALLASVNLMPSQAGPSQVTLPIAMAQQAPAAPTMVMPPPSSAPPTPPPAHVAPPPPPPPPASLGGPHAGGSGGSKGVWLGVAGFVLMGAGWFAMAMLGVIPFPAFLGGGSSDPGVVEVKTAPVESATPPAPSPAVEQQPSPAPSSTATAPVQQPQSQQPQTQAPPPRQTAAPQTAPTVAVPPPSVAKQQQPVAVTPASTTSSYAPPPSPQQLPQQQQQQVPAMDPQAVRDLEEARQRFNGLAVRAAAAKASVRSLQEQQRASGFGMRRDILEAVTRFDYLMKEASDSLGSRNGTAAKNSLETAERNLQMIEKFLGN
jgi:serine/threonine-protein kinase